MKKLTKQNFTIILVGLIGTMFYRVINLGLIRRRDFSGIKRLNEEQIAQLKEVLFKLNFLSMIIFMAICGYLLFRLVHNRKKPEGQKYLTLLFVMAILGAVVHTFALCFGHLVSLINLGFILTIIIGCSSQKNVPARKSLSTDNY